MNDTVNMSNAISSYLVQLFKGLAGNAEVNKPTMVHFESYCIDNLDSYGNWVNNRDGKFGKTIRKHMPIRFLAAYYHMLSCFYRAKEAIINK